MLHDKQYNYLCYYEQNSVIPNSAHSCTPLFKFITYKKCMSWNGVARISPIFETVSSSKYMYYIIAECIIGF